MKRRTRLVTIVAVVGAAIVVTLLLGAVVPATYRGSSSIVLGGTSSNVWRTAVCINGPTLVSFSWTVGTYIHNSSAALTTSSNRVATLQVWSADGSSARPIYNETGTGGNGSYESQGTESFQAVGYWGNTAVYLQLDWQEAGHPLTGPTTSIPC